MVGNVEDLEKSAADNDEEEDSEEDGADFVILLFFLNKVRDTGVLRDLSMLEL